MSTTRIPVQAIPKYFLYGETLREVDPRFLHVESIAERSCLHNWIIRPHAHRELHHFLLLRNGGGELQAETQTLQFGPMNVVAIPAAFVHGFAFQPDTDGWIITVSRALLQRLSSDNPELQPLLGGDNCLLLERVIVKQLMLPQLFVSLVREYRGTAPGRNAAIEAWLTIILVAIRRATYERSDASASKPGSDSNLVARYQALLEAQFKTPLGMPEYAAQLCVSPERLRSACTRAVGTSPVRLLAERRLVEAKRELLYTNMTVAKIAYDCGFEDPAYFTRFFTQLTGETPSAYRSSRRLAMEFAPSDPKLNRQS